jgi:hypothetical protein
VLRVDPDCEMGEQNFIKPVYSTKCQSVLCFTWDNGAFYIMDEKKQLKKLVQDEKSHQLRVDMTLEVLPGDKNSLYYDAFDEFLVSDEAMHWNDKVFYFSEQKKKDNFTWGQSQIMALDHKHV